MADSQARFQPAELVMGVIGFGKRAIRVAALPCLFGLSGCAVPGPRMTGTGPDGIPYESFMPAGGSGPVVVILSGHSGASNYGFAGEELARRGYEVMLLNGDDILPAGGGLGSGEPILLRNAIMAAQKLPGAWPGKVGVIGFSQGGGAALAYATNMPDLVSVVIAMYPATYFVFNPRLFVRHFRVPTLVLAGGSDAYHQCCLIATAQQMEAAAQAQGAPFQLVVYPNAGHSFVHPGRSYSGDDAADAWRRTFAVLQQYLRAQPQARLGG
jgi:dienelactone hydrolase